MREILDYFGGGLSVGVFRISTSREFISVGKSLPGLFGYSKKEFLNLTFDQPLADPFMYTHLKLKFRKHHELCNERILMIRKDGANFWAHLTVRLVEERGKKFAAGIIEDITAVVTMENHLKGVENEYQRTRYELDRFIYSASHDIRSPISSILGLINIMKLDYTDYKSKKFIELMEVSAHRLDRFVIDLSSFAENSRGH